MRNVDSKSNFCGIYSLQQSSLYPDKEIILNLLLVLHQIDRLYDWKKSPETDVVVTLKKQKKNTKDEFDERAKAIVVEFAEQVSIITSSLILPMMAQKLTFVLQH